MNTGQGHCAVTFGIGVGISGIEGVGKPIKYSSCTFTKPDLNLVVLELR